MGRSPEPASQIDHLARPLLRGAAGHGLLGDRNWWLPGWLDRALPRLQVKPISKSTSEPQRASPGPFRTDPATPAIHRANASG